MQTYQPAIRLQRWILVIGIILLGLKFYAWWATQSVSILTDALESIVNVVAGSITLYSLILANRPRDTSHPYGHGKAEFISAGIEGSLILVAGLFIYYQAISSFLVPHPIKKLGSGLLMVLIGGGINFSAGIYAVKVGKKTQSLGITASGKHLVSDGYSSLGLVLGLAAIMITQWMWLDGVIALFFGTLIIVTGYKILRQSLAGIMGRADEVLLEKLILLLQKIRKENWIDLHNLRVIKYGNKLHIDCHLTLPWFLNLNEAHIEVDALRKEIENEFGTFIEILVHTDACLPKSCNICQKKDCTQRTESMKMKLEWNLKNLFANEKHTYND